MPKRRPPKAKPRKPDEVFSSGPFQMARFGKNVVWKSDWPEGAFEEAQARALAHLPIVTAAIDELVDKIATLVRQLKPERVLYRAWWEMAMKYFKIEAESDVEMDDGLSVRMVDYVQSIIASIQPEPEQRDPTEEDWSEMRGLVEALFMKINIEFQIASTAAHRDEPGYSHEFEEFKFQAQLMWVNVRGRRYQAHDPTYLKEVFSEHSAIIQQLFGITADQFVSGLVAVWRSLSTGIQDMILEMESFRQDVLAAVEVKIKSGTAEGDFADVMRQVVVENGWEERSKGAFQGLFGLDLFDLRKLTGFPDALLEELSWSPGQETDFFGEATDGSRKGWPLRIWPITKRPFLKLDGAYYCFDLYSFLDNIYRVMGRVILRLAPVYAEEWKLKQQAISENLPLEYFRRLLPDAHIYQSVFYRGDTGDGKIGWCEADALIIYQDHMLVVEARGGAFTYTSPATDFSAYVASLRNLVLKPANQGARFVKYLESADEVAIHDQERNEIGRLRKRDFRQVTICPVTLDPFTELAAQVQHLRKIGVDVGTRPVWVISIDDLRVYADILTQPLVFLHYVEKRMEAFNSEIIHSNDELDHLGLYLKHNDYVQYASELGGQKIDRIGFVGYRTEIDKFFRERMFDPHCACKLQQDIPLRFREIIDGLHQIRPPGAAQIASYLLDMDGGVRDEISRCINTELAQQPSTRRPKPLSVHGEVALTIFCWSPSIGLRQADEALFHARSVAVAAGDQRRVLLDLEYDAGHRLVNIAGTWIETDKILASDLPLIRANAERLRVKRIDNAKADQQKIGRNDPCPCGSSKKYKRCCLVR